MSKLQWLGYGLLASPFVVLGIVIVLVNGFVDLLVISAITLMTLLVVTAGSYLVVSERYKND